MKPFTKYEGTIVPIMNDNIDTDQLIPKQYLKSIEKTGFGQYVFDEWALQDYGFHVIVAGGYSGIFYMNWLNNGHLPITLLEADRLELAKLPGDAKVTVDLENNKLTANGKDYFFELEESWKQRLLKGLDSIGLTLEHEDEIRKYEESHK